jgi:hypothetical protein
LAILSSFYIFSVSVCVCVCVRVFWYSVDRGTSFPFIFFFNFSFVFLFFCVCMCVRVWRGEISCLNSFDDIRLASRRRTRPWIPAPNRRRRMELISRSPRISSLYTYRPFSGGRRGTVHIHPLYRSSTLSLSLSLCSLSVLSTLSLSFSIRKSF